MANIDTPHRAETIGERGDVHAHLIARQAPDLSSSRRWWLANFTLGEKEFVTYVCEGDLGMAGVTLHTHTPFMAEVYLDAATSKELQPNKIRRIDER